MDMFHTPGNGPAADDITRLPEHMRLGTCSWSYKDWIGPFYAPGTKPAEYLCQYARHFPAVEIDSTFYATPARDTVRKWADTSPDGFRFAAKAPRLITHDAQLVHCQEPFLEFVDVMGELGEKRGPLLLQFPYFARARRPPLEDFVGRLDALLAVAPPDARVAVEVRNRAWLADPLLACLRKHRAALALIDHPWMPRPEELPPPARIATADFLYARWLGDRKGMEQRTTKWSETVLDRTEELNAWARVLLAVLTLASVSELWGFFNNHFAGFSPDSIRLFAKLWAAQQPSGSANATP